MQIYSYTNKNWSKLLEIFGVKILKNLDEVLNLNKTILLISDDKNKDIVNLKEKLDLKEVIVAALPSDGSSKFDKNELQSLIFKALGIISH